MSFPKKESVNNPISNFQSWKHIAKQYYAGWEDGIYVFRNGTSLLKPESPASGTHLLQDQIASSFTNIQTFHQLGPEYSTMGAYSLIQATRVQIVLAITSLGKTLL